MHMHVGELEEHSLEQKHMLLALSVDSHLHFAFLNIKQECQHRSAGVTSLYALQTSLLHSVLLYRDVEPGRGFWPQGHRQDGRW